MGAKFYVPGPNPIYTGTGASGAFEFFGWTIEGVSFQIDADHTDIRVDYGGNRAVDVMYSGEECSIPVTMQKFEEAVYQKLAARCSSPASITAGADMGALPAPATGVGMGTLLVAEGATFQLAIVNAMALSRSSTNDQVPIYVFPRCYVSGGIEVNGGIRLRNPRLTFRALNTVNPATLEMVLYHNVVPVSPALPAVS